MSPDFGTFLRLFGETLRDPEAMARQIVKLRLPHEFGWMALASVTALTVIVVYLEGLLPGRSNVGVTIGGRPFFDMIFLGSMTVVFIFTLYYAGRAMGGAGTFGGTLLIMTWFQAVVLVLITIQLIVAFLVPTFGGIAALIAVVVQLYCLIHFLNVLHEFDSLAKSAGLFFLSLIGFALGLALILTAIGGAAVVGGA